VLASHQPAPTFTETRRFEPAGQGAAPVLAASQPATTYTETRRFVPAGK
jgi:hypothetical protein